MGGFFSAPSAPAPQRAAPIISEPRKDKGGNIAAQREADDARKTSNRRKRVQAQSKVGKAASPSGLRTQLSSSPTRSGISTQ